MEDAQVLGVVEEREGTAEISYLDGYREVDAALLELTRPLQPTDVFRFAGKCVNSKCQHFDGSACNLATRISKLTEEVVSSPPRCAIRKTCRWYHQEGFAICLRCPQVTTSFDPRDEVLRQIAGFDRSEGRPPKGSAGFVE